ncbi:hypothetical protein PR048_001603 [Dryococelus australis]|uniref:Reverse transcriptase domain-containing protein n=1 Tax=Dryococelus australis TaxID=614101 RepID=A0ABQ9IJ69_9NEOP|nr:hypothetical protein PR048_001603 [Dryococelus australis]
MEYTDDTALFVAGEDTPTLQARVQSGLLSHSRYYDDWGIRPNPAKRSCVFYTKRHSVHPLLILFRLLSLMVPCCQNLGVHLDVALTWHRHIVIMVGLAKGLLAYNTALQLILGRPCRTAVVALYEMASVESPAAFICQLTSRFYHWTTAHFNPLITEIGDYDVESPGPHRRIRDILCNNMP